jgi:hypothetical protein
MYRPAGVPSRSSAPDHNQHNRDMGSDAAVIRPVFAAIVGSVLVGTPMVAFLWHVLNELLGGHVNPLRLAAAVPVLVLFVLFVRLLGRRLAALEPGHR